MLKIVVVKNKKGQFNWHAVRNGRVLFGTSNQGYVSKAKLLRTLELAVGNLAKREFKYEDNTPKRQSKRPPVNLRLQFRCK